MQVRRCIGCGKSDNEIGDFDRDVSSELMRIKPRWMVVVAAVLYVISFALPVFSDSTYTFGIAAFVWGWCPPYTPLWFANVAFMYGVHKLAKNDYRRARNAGLVATVMAILYLPLHLWEDSLNLHPLLIGYYT